MVHYFICVPLLLLFCFCVSLFAVVVFVYVCCWYDSHACECVWYTTLYVCPTFVALCFCVSLFAGQNVILCMERHVARRI